MATLSTGNVRQSTVVPHLPPGENLAFGDFLRQARERRGMTLQDIARETKIPFRHLDALEHGNLAAVPQGIYRRAEIRAFAQTVGLDQNVALAELERALHPAPARVAQSSTQQAHVRDPRRAVVAGALAILASLAVLAVSSWNRTAPVSVESLTPSAAAPTTPVEQAAIPPASPALPTTEPPPSEAVPVSVASAEAPPNPIIQDGQITVVTEPLGARVTIDGVGRGTTPLTVASVPFGSHRIRVTLDGYLGEERLARVDAARPTSSLQISLTPSR
jgi:cytoskeletal protein RodZ